MYNSEIIQNFKSIATPFYCYDLGLLKRTAQIVSNEAKKYDYHVHYAMKANCDDKVLKVLSDAGFGADCVSGNEVHKAIECGFDAQGITFAGVGKTDEEINLGLLHNIFCFNCESIQEMEVINELAEAQNKIATIAIRINPNVDAHTHHYITTGLEENKFGISEWQFEEVIETLKKLHAVKLIAFHFHIGSQITEMHPFESLCERVNFFQDWFAEKGVLVDHINLGGGLGIDYYHPEEHPISAFAEYFSTIHKHLKVRSNQKVHFELGRSMVAQCGSLISKVIYIKGGQKKNFAIVDAGFTDLIRPALYGAYHSISNLTSTEAETTYDVVGPICESSDVFRKDVVLPETKRGDLLCFHSAGAYGEIMASNYNLRKLPGKYYI